MRLNLRAVAANMRRATTEELLDRVTVFRNAMEPAAVDLIEGELARRGLSDDDIREHERGRREVMMVDADGTAVRCSFCNRPAVSTGRGWHRLWGRVPLFPRLFARCEVHEQT